MQKIIITREEEKKIIEKRKNIYNGLFDDQIKTLEDKGCPLEIVKVFKYQKDKVIEMTIRTDISESDIAFLPIIPKRTDSSRGVAKSGYRLVRSKRKNSRRYPRSRVRRGSSL